jgi:hypothetical protein
VQSTRERVLARPTDALETGHLGCIRWSVCSVNIIAGQRGEVRVADSAGFARIVVALLPSKATGSDLGFIHTHSSIRSAGATGVASEPVLTSVRPKRT